MEQSSEVDDPAASAAVDRVRWAVHVAATRTRWKPACLSRAVAAQSMLRRRSVASTLYLGVDPARSLEAHAWVRAGSVFVTGGDPQPTRFVVVSTFS